MKMGSHSYGMNMKHSYACALTRRRSGVRIPAGPPPNNSHPITPGSLLYLWSKGVGSSELGVDLTYTNKVKNRKARVSDALL